MYKTNGVAVVMPIHNEEDHVRRAIDRVPAFVDWIVAIDDGSTDATWQRLSEITDARVIKLKHARNQGVGAATKRGYKTALQLDADFIAVMDGDGQMDGEDLYRLLDAATAGADYVKGNRFIESTTIACMPPWRFIGNTLFSWLTRRAAAFEPSLDAQCGYSVIRRDALLRINLEALYDRYGFPNEMFFAACHSDLVVTSVAVRTIYGDEVSGINPFTAVPMIVYLIARNYCRRVFLPEPSTPLLKLQESESKSTN